MATNASSSVKHGLDGQRETPSDKPRASWEQNWHHFWGTARADLEPIREPAGRRDAYTTNAGSRIGSYAATDGTDESRVESREDHHGGHGVTEVFQERRTPPL